MSFDLFMNDTCPRCRRPITLRHRATHNQPRAGGAQVQMFKLRTHDDQNSLAEGE